MHRILFTIKSVPTKTQVAVLAVVDPKKKHTAIVYHADNENLAMMFAPDKSPFAAFLVSFVRIQRFNSRMHGNKRGTISWYSFWLSSNALNTGSNCKVKIEDG